MLTSEHLLDNGLGWRKYHARQGVGQWWQVSRNRTVEVSQDPQKISNRQGVYVAPVDEILRVAVRDVNL